MKLDAPTFNRTTSLKELMTIPGIGKSIANDLLRIGIRHIAELKGKNQELLFDQSNAVVGVVQDRCLLYTFRCAVYFAETKPSRQNPDKLKWWNWKDIKPSPRKKKKNNMITKNT
jgi:hypothetical protein